MTQKIVSAVCRIAQGSPEKLSLGEQNIIRDWGFAPEYVDPMWRMLQQDSADDYIIATGEANSLQDFVAEAFSIVGLDWHDYVHSDATLFRPTDLPKSQVCVDKASRQLGWQAKFKMRDVVRKMILCKQTNTFY